MTVTHSDLVSALQSEVAQLKARLAEAAEQEAATAEILRIIGASSSDTRPTFQAIAQSATRLCRAGSCLLILFDGRLMHLAAHHNVSAARLKALEAIFPIPPSRTFVGGRAVLAASVVQVEDIRLDAEYGLPTATTVGYRSVLGVPMLRDGVPIGAIVVARDHVAPFSGDQIELLRTFAAQAVIGIENTRLFNALEHRNRQLTTSLEQQTATSELLKVIGRSSLDLQPVFETMAETAVRLCDAERAMIYRFDGDMLRVVAAHNVSAEIRDFVARNPIRLGRGSAAGRAGLERRAIHLPDVQSDPDYHYGVIRVAPVRTILATPMVKSDALLGVIAIFRTEVRPFADSQVALMATLADQAAIAIDNARLFQELEQRTRDLTRSVGELRALGEVSQAVSSTLDLEAVLATIVSRSVELSGCHSGIIYEFDPDARRFHARASHRVTSDHLAALQAAPIPLGDGAIGRAGELRRPVEVADVEAGDQLVPEQVRSHLARDGIHSVLAVPLVREDRLLGGIVMLRRERGSFSAEVVATLQTFATQSVLAIQNARLFQEIHRQKQYADALVQTSPVAIITMDLRGTVVGWNPGAERLFGYSAHEAIGRPIAERVASPQTRAEVTDHMHRTAAGEWLRAIGQRARKDGTLVDVEISSMAVMVDGVKVGLLVIYHDITELLRARREAEAANEAKGAFLATMSHEIRTPLNAVIGMSGLLLSTPLGREQREYAEVIHQSGDALLTVINDILDFSKIEAGKLELEVQRFDLRECIEGALDLVAMPAAEKGLDLAYLVEDGTPAAIVGDVTRLRQILLNLLSNAVKFTERGEVVLSVAARPVAAGAPLHELTFSVRDTGIGIPAERLSRLFQSFSQIDASTTRRYGGTGLGLAISRRLTELMGGRIAVTSEVGKGSEFRVTIQAAAAAASAGDGSAARVPASLRGKRALVVDDNATNRQILSAHLGEWRIAARATASPREALDWLEAGDHFDVCILDMHMPEMDGVVLATAIRARRAGASVPLVLLSSLGRRELDPESRLFAAYLHKPIKPSQLFDALVAILAEQPVAARGRARANTLDPGLARRHPLRILLAEDNVVNQKVALRVLGQMGYRADVAANGLEAIAAVERQSYDVILMDVHMPDLDGCEAAREIKRRWPAGDHPRLVAMTANAMAQDRERCAAAGMEDYVAKPIRIDELVDALLRCPRRPEEDGAAGGQGALAPAIDRTSLDRLTAMMGDRFVAELIDTFIEDGQHLIATLRRALAERDRDGFRRAAHSLKSSSETLGATALAARARELEAIVRAGDLAETEPRIEPTARDYEHLVRELGELRRGFAA